MYEEIFGLNIWLFERCETIFRNNKQFTWYIRIKEWCFSLRSLVCSLRSNYRYLDIGYFLLPRILSTPWNSLLLHNLIASKQSCRFNSLLQLDCNGLTIFRLPGLPILRCRTENNLWAEWPKKLWSRPSHLHIISYPRDWTSNAHDRR